MPLRLYRRTGRRNFYVRGTVNGIAVNESCGTDDETRAAQYLDKATATAWDCSLAPPGSTVTFATAALGYLADKAAHDKRLVDRLVNLWGDRMVGDVGQSAFDEAAASFGQAGGTANRNVYTPGVAVLHWAAKRGWCPWVRLQRPKAGNGGRDRVLSPEEAGRLLAAFHSPYARAVALVMIYTGARVGEALALTWDHVDLARSHVSLWEFKTRKPRGAALPKAVVVALANLPLPHEGPIFPWTSRRAYLTHWHAALKVAGLGRDVVPHTCRHTFATWARRYAGADWRELMAAGGWKDPKSVARYSHVTSDEVAALIAKLPEVG